MVRSSAASVSCSDKTLLVPNLLDKVLPCLPACAPCLFHHIPNLERAKDKSPIAAAKARAPGQIAFYPLSFNFEFKWKSTVGNSINTKCLHTSVFLSSILNLPKTTVWDSINTKCLHKINCWGFNPTNTNCCGYLLSQNHCI